MTLMLVIILTNWSITINIWIYIIYVIILCNSIIFPAKIISWYINTFSWILIDVNLCSNCYYVWCIMLDNYDDDWDVFWIYMTLLWHSVFYVGIMNVLWCVDVVLVWCWCCIITTLWWVVRIDWGKGLIWCVERGDHFETCSCYCVDERCECDGKVVEGYVYMHNVMKRVEMWYIRYNVQYWCVACCGVIFDIMTKGVDIIVVGKLCMVMVWVNI